MATARELNDEEDDKIKDLDREISELRSTKKDEFERTRSANEELERIAKRERECVEEQHRLRTEKHEREQHEMKQANCENVKLNDTIRKLKHSLDEAEKHSKAQSHKIAELEASVTAAQRELYTAKASAAQERSESLDSAFAELEKRLSNTVKLLSETKEELSETRQRLSDVQERLTVAELVTAATQQRALQESDNSEQLQLELTPQHQPTTHTEIENRQSDSSKGDTELQLLQKQLADEKKKKEEAVNKLAELMNRKEESRSRMVNEADMRKKEKECLKLEQELKQERHKMSQLRDQLQQHHSDMQALLNEETQRVKSLQLELDAKETEIEQLKQKVAPCAEDTSSIHSSNELDLDDTLLECRLEGWLSVPHKTRASRFLWKKQYVVVSTKKILFFASESCKQNNDPELVLDIDKLFHVRPVTQGDVYRAEPKDIPCIFLILYAKEGEKKKTENREGPIAGVLHYKGHDFLQIHYRTPTNCESCNKTLWHMIHPPTALECQRCELKFHKDHFDNNEEFVGPCKVNQEAQAAKEMLLMATSADEQKMWVQRLSKKVSRKGISQQPVTCGAVGDRPAAGPATTKQKSKKL